MTNRQMVEERLKEEVVLVIDLSVGGCRHPRKHTERGMGVRQGPRNLKQSHSLRPSTAREGPTSSKIEDPRRS